MDKSTDDYLSRKNPKRIIFIILGIGILILLCSCILIGVIFWEDILAGINAMMDGESNLPLILILILVATLFLMVFPVLLILFVRWRNTKTMDRIFEPLGLKGESYILTGRQYHGVFQGRKISIFILRGPTIEIRMRGNIRTHFMAIRAGKIHSAVLSNVREEPIRIENRKLEDVIFYGPDDNWLRALFSDNNAVDSLIQLLFQGINWAVIRRVDVKPGEVSLTIYRSKKLMFNLDVTEKEVRTVLNDLLNLNQSIELAPAPTVIEDIAEKSGENAINRINPKIVLIIIILLVGFPACLIVGGFLLTLLVSGSI